MPYAIIHHFPGGTKENYLASVTAAHGAPDKLPDGQIFHASGPVPGGWTITAFHESKESWERFRDTVLMPKLMKGVAGGFPTPPVETTFETHSVLKA